MKFSDRGSAIAIIRGITESADTACFLNGFYINLRRREASKRGANRDSEEEHSKTPDKGLD